MSRSDPFERIEWTPPILGWQYGIFWEEHQDGLRRIWTGLSDKKIQGITFSASIEPGIRSNWVVVLHGLNITRSSNELYRAIEMVEADVETMKEWLGWLETGQ